MTMGEHDVFKCLCPPKFGGPLCEGKLHLVLQCHLARTVS